MRLSGRPILIILVALAGVALLIERLIVTDAERLEIWATDVAEAAARGDIEGVRPHLAEEFVYGRLGKEQALNLLKLVYQRYKPTDIRINLTNMVFTEQGGTAEAAIAVEPQQGFPYGFGFDVRFVREGDGFLLVEAKHVRGTIPR